MNIGTVLLRRFDMKLMVKLPMIFGLALSIILIIVLQGCGKKSDAAPDGSTIEFNPSGYTLAIDTAVCLTPINIVVRYPDNTPHPRAFVTISGGFAVPNVDGTVVSGAGLYQFYSTPNCGGVPLDSGFQVQTDDNGVIFLFSCCTCYTNNNNTDTDISGAKFFY